MQPAPKCFFLILTAIFLFATACGQPETATEEVSEEPVEVVDVEPAEAESLADPDETEAAEVIEFVTAWVAEQADEEGIYDIPARGEFDLAGTLGAFHSVHRQDDDTYSVCVDFLDGESTYDVDFFVDSGAEGLILAEHYLHKVDGEAIE